MKIKITFTDRVGKEHSGVIDILYISKEKLQEEKDKVMEMIRLRFDEHMTFEDIGKIYGVTRQRIHKKIGNIK